jgi:hypothetical protein
MEAIWTVFPPGDAHWQMNPALLHFIGTIQEGTIELTISKTMSSGPTSKIVAVRVLVIF